MKKCKYLEDNLCSIARTEDNRCLYNVGVIKRKPWCFELKGSTKVTEQEIELEYKRTKITASLVGLLLVFIVYFFDL